MYSVYTDTFSRLAKEYECYIVAGSASSKSLKCEGSVFLPKISAFGKLGNEGLYNVSLTFDPKGEICHVVHKVNLVPEEQGFLDSGVPDQVNTFSTQFGYIGVLICADSWYPCLYEVSFWVKGIDRFRDSIRAMLKQYLPAVMCHRTLIGISFGEVIVLIILLKMLIQVIQTTKRKRYLCQLLSHYVKEMWSKYSVKGRIHATNAKIGLNSFAHGSVWDMSSGGTSFICKTSNGELTHLSESQFESDYEDLIILVVDE